MPTAPFTPARISYLPFACLYFAATTMLHAAQPEYFSHTQTSTWQEFANASTKKTPKKKWVWISRITLKSKKTVKVKQLTLKWHGKKLGKIFASLFQKYKHNNNVIPIERNVISDGKWNPSTQEIVFPLDEKIVIAQDYYLVLSFPRSSEKKVKEGHFSLCDVCSK